MKKKMKIEGKKRKTQKLKWHCSGPEKLMSLRAKLKLKRANLRLEKVDLTS